MTETHSIYYDELLVRALQRAGTSATSNWYAQICSLWVIPGAPSCILLFGLFNLRCINLLLCWTKNLFNQRVSLTRGKDYDHIPHHIICHIILVHVIYHLSRFALGARALQDVALIPFWYICNYNLSINNDSY